MPKRLAPIYTERGQQQRSERRAKAKQHRKKERRKKYKNDADPLQYIEDI